jgi:hypothetical protein
MGQLSAKACPVCGGENGGRWTCDPCTKTVAVMRGLVRGLQQWRSSLEAMEVAETIADPTGRTWCLWDVERFYAYRRQLPERMQTAIELMLYQGMFERDVARSMGISESNPVGVYVTVGLVRLLAMTRAGSLPGCRIEFDVDLLPPAPVRFRRGQLPRCSRAGCNHAISFHGRERGRCRVMGCRCAGWAERGLERAA